MERKGIHISIAAINCMVVAVDILLELVRLAISSTLGGNSFGRTYDTWYPLTRICPTYLSSRGGGLEDEDEVDEIEPKSDV